MNDKLGGIPNAFYDLIVFSSSTALFAVGVCLGLGQTATTWLRAAPTLNILLYFALFVFCSYEYGRIAEAWSAVFVQTPLKFLRKHTRLFQSRDFLAPLDTIESSLGIDLSKRLRPGGKWAVYFFALAINQKIGTDLLKRYAWEKLSRSSAFTFCILGVTSVTSGAIRLLFPASPFHSGEWAFGTLKYNIVVCFFSIITYTEYYYRNCWNNDLLERVVPVLAAAAKFTSPKPVSGDGQL